MTSAMKLCMVAWHSGRTQWSLASKPSLSCARPASDKWPVIWLNRPLQVSHLGQLSLSSFRGR